MIEARSPSGLFHDDDPAGTKRIREAFWKIRSVRVRHGVAQRIASSRLRFIMTLVFSFVFWGALFWLFYDGFDFLNRQQIIASQIVEMLFSLFFGSLMIMLVFSTGIILHAGLFASRETEKLLVSPISTDRIFAFKFQEAMFFSCWGFILLGSPMILAYGLKSNAPLSFYPFAVGYFLSFALIPGTLGALICLLVANFLPRRRWELLIGTGVLIVAFAIFQGFRAWKVAQGTALTRSWVNSLLGELDLANLPFLPSHWISRGLLSAASTRPSADSWYFLLMLVANGLFLYLITSMAYYRGYRRGFNRVHSECFTRRKKPAYWLPLFIHRFFAFLPAKMRILIHKDLQIFFRDPLQWSQVLIFSGLLGIYFVNLSRVHYYATSPYWRNLIGFFNLSVTGLLLATFTSRFIFPLLSLEGQKFWVLGLSPISRDSILWGKFAFAAGGAILVTFGLTAVGAWVLGLGPFLICVHLITILILCFGVSGISVGLGARFPDMRERDPSRIAAGFGGTLNLVTSLLFILIVVATVALPCHLYSITQSMEAGDAGLEMAALRNAGLSIVQFRFWIVISLCFAVFVGLIATFLPMRLGIRHFRQMEIF